MLRAHLVTHPRALLLQLLDRALEVLDGGGGEGVDAGTLVALDPPLVVAADGGGQVEQPLQHEHERHLLAWREASSELRVVSHV